MFSARPTCQRLACHVTDLRSRLGLTCGTWRRRTIYVGLLSHRYAGVRPGLCFLYTNEAWLCPIQLWLWPVFLVIQSTKFFNFSMHIFFLLRAKDSLNSLHFIYIRIRLQIRGLSEPDVILSYALLVL